MNDIAEGEFYNAAALYSPSVEMKNRITRARDTIMRKLCPSAPTSGELIFTSGATESNNTVIFGKAAREGHLLLLEGEHSSAVAPVKQLADNGFAVDIIPLQRNGMADVNALKTFVRPTTNLVVFGLVNSDTGAIHDARGIVSAVRAVAPRAHIHCDATQAFCKLPFCAAALDVDSIAISAHKIHGPKGIGALWLKKSGSVRPLLYGGGQQNLRPGTENTPAVLGFAVAVANWDTDKNFAHVSELHQRLINGLPAGVTVNGINNNPYITNLQLDGHMGQTVMNALDAAGKIGRASCRERV